MVTWFWQRPRTGERALALRSRGDLGDATRVDFEELAPDVDTFLGQAAYLQLGFFETLSELIASTPELVQKESLSRAAGAALTKHEALIALIRERGDDPTALMLPFREPLDAFRGATHGVRPQETMLSVHITAGMLDDFYLALSASYGDTGRRVARILRADDDRQAIVDIIAATIASDPEWKALLAMWGQAPGGRHAAHRAGGAPARSTAARRRGEGRARLHGADGRALPADGRHGSRGLSDGIRLRRVSGCRVSRCAGARARARRGRRGCG